MRDLKHASYDLMKHFSHCIVNISKSMDRKCFTIKNTQTDGPKTYLAYWNILGLSYNIPFLCSGRAFSKGLCSERRGDSASLLF